MLPGQRLPPDEEALLDMFRDSLGVNPEERIERMQLFLRAFPESPFADGIRRDIEALRAAAEGARSPGPVSAADQRDLIRRAVGSRVFALPLTQAHVDQPVIVGVVDYVETTSGRAYDHRQPEKNTP